MHSIMFRSNEVEKDGRALISFFEVLRSDHKDYFSLDDLSQQISILLPTRRWRPRRQRITQHSDSSSSCGHHLAGIILFFLWKDKNMVHILIVFTFPISISIPPFVPVDSKTLDVPDDIYTVVSDCSYYLISPQKKKACENYHFSSSLDVAAETQIRL